MNTAQSSRFFMTLACYLKIRFLNGFSSTGDPPHIAGVQRRAMLYTAIGRFEQLY